MDVIIIFKKLHLKKFVNFIQGPTTGNTWRQHGLLVIIEDPAAMVQKHLGPLLLTWFNFNPSMDK